MSKITVVSSHGPDEKYCRTVVPIEIAKALGIRPGSVFGWRINDNDSAVVRVITK